LADVDATTTTTPPPETQKPSNTGYDTIMAARARQKLLMEQFNELGSTQTRSNSFQPHHPLHRPVAPKSLTLSALVASGAQLGHARALTRPSFLPYTYGYRSGITIIDLDQTLPLLRRAANVTRAIAASNGSILFVGTHETLRPAVRKAAERMGRNAYHIGTRWLPGTLTNAPELFGPETVRNMNAKPDLVIFLNPLQNLHAIRECAIMHIPTIGIIDSNADPRIVMYPIPANDESVRTAELVAGTLSIAGREGIQLLEKTQREAKEEASSRFQKVLHTVQS
jgi:small subunit ribosomal protein S2